MSVADGQGGMAPVQDRRFDPAHDWPIQFEVPKEQADTWLEYFSAECARRAWSSGGIRQMEARENSGSVTVNVGNAEKPELAVVWERKRGDALLVRARHVGGTDLPAADLQALFDAVNERCRSGVLERLYMRRTLEYQGLPWRGEFWLDDTLRLGPPSRQYEDAMFGPRAIVVDALVQSVGSGDVVWVFDQQLGELAAFLSVVLGTNVRVTQQGRRVWTLTEDGTDSVVRTLGYWEQERPSEMPARGVCGPVSLRQVSRPDFSHHGLHDQTIGEKSLPSDTADLWASYRALTPELRRQFLQAAAKWQEALTVWGDRETLSVSLMVVACEALKPAEPQYRDHNVYHVVEALLGDDNAKRLDTGSFRAQAVRSAHLHAGEFRGSEFVQAAINSSYQDPTFDADLCGQTHRTAAD